MLFLNYPKNMNIILFLKIIKN